MNQGYFRHPAVHSDTVVFVSEDDLWSVPLQGGVARRLTAGRGEASHPTFSPDGASIAFTSSEELHGEVYTMPAEGGQTERLTFLGGNASVRTWSPDGRIVFSSDHNQPFARVSDLHSVPANGGWHQPLGYGMASDISYGPKGASVIGRHTNDPARWKRYRGGTAGQLWVDPKGNGQFERILRDIGGNLASPMWIKKRIYFISDHEGIGNIYSVKPDGSDVTRHTHHDEFYARHAATDGTTIVYHAGAEIFRLSVADNTVDRIDIDFHSPRTYRNRKFVPAARYLEQCSLHPKGHSIAVTTRGKLFTMPLWEEAPRQWGQRDGVRYRHATWLHDGKTLVAMSDESGEELLEVFSGSTAKPSKTLDKLDLGRPIELIASPVDNRIAILNHRCELIVVDIDKKSSKVIDTSSHGQLSGFDWSRDGRWIAYGYNTTARTSCIKIADLKDGSTHQVTQPDFRDYSPAFDPAGKYLYFLSFRQFNPVYDHHVFDLGFPRGVKPMVMTLQVDTPSPFIEKPKGLGSAAADDDVATTDDDASATAKAAAKKTTKDTKKADTKKDTKPKSVKIDFDGIERRVLSLPVPDGLYMQITAIPGKVLFTSYDVEGSLGDDHADSDDDGQLEMYSFEDQNHEIIASGVSDFSIAPDDATLIYHSGHRIRAIKAGTVPADGPPAAGRKSGWLDLSRVRVSVNPGAEWQQMLREAWRLQRDHFWTADMSGIDWPAALNRYMPLVDKVSTRREFSDLMWELQGELGTSHAYEMGGDHRRSPAYGVGHLGVDLTFDEKSELYKIKRIVPGDSWNQQASSPLGQPGLKVAEGDTLLAIAGQSVTAQTSPNELLVNQAGTRVALEVGDSKGKKRREVIATTLRSDRMLRYRDWVEANRAAVHSRTNERVGYVHIPDMGPHGYAEFHRYLVSELNAEALVVDVRYNGGGHVSQLLLEKLMRKRVGYDISRWGEPEPYPSDSVLGPIVAITNELAGSDGDIFSHCFKLMEIGPLVGTRTWGGVIGINPSHSLVDGSMTTQPEYSFWFKDVGWKVENYGTDPQHEVDIKPQDFATGSDPQMDAALHLISEMLERDAPSVPDFEPRPELAAPPLNHA